LRQSLGFSFPGSTWERDPGGSTSRGARCEFCQISPNIILRFGIKKEDDSGVIFNQHENGWEVIYHRAHALLAAQIAGNWHKKDLPQRIIETVAAISHHDDLEKEWEVQTKFSLVPRQEPGNEIKEALPR
jgi:Protein of unknown function (DUF3891)